ncbi:WXG100 family type VII secretion target [Gordonia sp. zg691]|uniref:WXG100 family type VII secretion target n=1 Tax=Gordonia jinghuaiqii TaxID=2758710 RepID=UPI00166273DF|nr:WXG100 family type VII secretion target [Gordonia jinghuaiqii]MBD0862471.1 WXG100 family type VII secretion target [Gordonia jinghuaiqii]
MELEADLERLRAVAQDVAETHGDITDDWSRITKRAESLFGGTWSGTAADSYSEPWGHCCEGVASVVAGLETMGRLLASAAQTYAHSDTSSARHIYDAAPYTALRLP